ncbi:MAG: ATP-binding protein [Cypionkella sp.]
MINRLRFALALVVVLVCAFGIGVLDVEVARQIDRQSSSGSDNTQWALDQADVELLNLELAMVDAQVGTIDLAALRTRYDVFFSRVNTLERGEVFLRLRDNQIFADGLLRMQQFIAVATPWMDGPDNALLAALPDLRVKAEALFPHVHNLALAGLSIFAAQSDVARQGVKQTLINLALLTLALVAALVAMLVMVLRLDRRNRLRAAENAETMSRLDAVVETSLDAVITLDDAGRIVDFNPSASRTFGYPREDVVGRYLNLLVPPDATGKAQLPALNEPLTQGRRRQRITARRRDGIDFPAEISLSTARAGGRPLHVVFLRDLSQQLAAEQALVKARDEALVGEKAKADLLVVMSHEIRTPLNGMIGTIELLDGTDLAPHQREYLRIMAASGRLLMHHVNDVLDIARLDSGKSLLTLAPLDLAKLVGEVIENQSPASQTNGNTLAFIPPADGRTTVIGDAAQLRQVLLNLVGNAVKFTRNGKITVEILHRSGRGPTEISVRDTGIGIAREDLGRVFEDFVTLDPSYARHSSGTGLGLGIVRRIVTRMGGKIRAESGAGKGSVFRVTLPLSIIADTEQPAPVPVPHLGSARLSVLVVEDNDFNRLIVRDILSKDGHSVTEAVNGEEGIAQANAQAFDVILMDISMPGIDGLQAAEQIRQGNGASRAAPIVALTAHAMQAETDRFLAGGMREVLIKPITRDALRAVLAGLHPPPVEVAVEEDVLLDIAVLAELRSSLGTAKSDKLILRFLSDTHTRIARLQKRTGGDPAEGDLLADVHRMTGTAAMFGARAFHARLNVIEDLCKHGERAAAQSQIPGLGVLWQQTALAYRTAGYREAEPLPQASSLR